MPSTQKETFCRPNFSTTSPANTKVMKEECMKYSACCIFFGRTNTGTRSLLCTQMAKLTAQTWCRGADVDCLAHNAIAIHTLHTKVLYVTVTSLSARISRCLVFMPGMCPPLHHAPLWYTTHRSLVRQLTVSTAHKSNVLCRECFFRYSQGLIASVVSGGRHRPPHCLCKLFSGFRRVICKLAELCDVGREEAVSSRLGCRSRERSGSRSFPVAVALASSRRYYAALFRSLSLGHSSKMIPNAPMWW